MSDSPQALSCRFKESKPEPKLRHEFVGMMFAVAIGEVGIQVAGLVQVGHWTDHLSAWSHIILATLVIATSWVGWTLSVAPGARKDVEKIFQWDFLVLLLDVILVILYFILAKSTHVEPKEEPRPDSAYTVARTLFWIFLFYFVWDILTKVIIFGRDVKKEEGKKWYQYIVNNFWWKQYGLRVVPTIICLILISVGTWLLRRADQAYVSLDLAFIALVLLFRALKDVVSAFWPTEKKEQEQSAEEVQGEKERKDKRSKRWSPIVTILCILLMAAAIWSYYSSC